VIARTLLDLGLLSGPVGQRVMTAAVVDDVVGWILLSVVSGLATTGFRAGALAVTVGALAAVPVLAGACGAVLRPAWRWLEREAAPGAVLAASVGLIVLSGAGMAALGMEPILGGLLAGLLIGNSSHRDTRFTAWNGPLGTAVLWVLAPIFFATAGLRMDLAALARPGGLALAGLFVLVAIVGKFAGVYAGARIGRLGHWEGVALGAGLNARGVIQVIVATVGLRLGILTPELYTAIILTALLTSILAGPWLSYAVRRIPAGVPPEPGPTELVPEGRPDHGQPVHR
jgi:Kef-type K+ transport system membrane component KefB